MKDLISKLQLEKERVQEQHRARISEFENKAKMADQEKAKKEQEFAKMLKEKRFVERRTQKGTLLGQKPKLSQRPRAS